MLTHPPHVAELQAEGSGTPTPSATRLSPKLVDDAARRIGALSLGVSVLLVVVQVFHQLVQPEMARLMNDAVILWITLATVLGGVALFALQRREVVSTRLTYQLGMGYVLLVALSVSMIETARPVDPATPITGISAVGPWIVAVGVFIPNRPPITLVVGLIMASTWPLAYAINGARFGFDAVPWGPWSVWPTFNYLMALVAFLINRRTYGREMAAQEALDLGSYRLQARIGEGGMGDVWRASHQLLARSAAIKLVKPDMLASASGRQADVSIKRFEREANVIAGLQSPHTVYLYDFGTTQDGRLYYVMELLDGISLQTLVTTFGPQPAGRVRAILRQACESLEEAHAQGLVHRDLKPSNIMICKVALRYDFVKVLDFGLAKSVRQTDATQLTMDGSATGTPGYMAPEISVGADQIDGRADIYALGCVAYFLLTGSQVFAADNPMRIALQHVQEAPPRPSSRTELPIPAALEDAVMQCLEKDPAARPRDVRALQRLLRDCDSPAWSQDAAARWWDRHLPATSSLRSFAQRASGTPAVIRKV